VFAKNQIVLVDTNVILEAHRVGYWVSLSQYFALHTVEKVVEETQTGYQNRAPEQTIPEATLRKQLRHVESVTDTQRAEFSINYADAVLDDGERDLVIYAGLLTQAQPAVAVWFLNSPDIATVRHAHRRQWLDHLISLEEMSQHLKLKAKLNLKNNYTRAWLSAQKTQFITGGKL
jgi:hypothetical protein